MRQANVVVSQAYNHHESSRLPLVLTGRMLDDYTADIEELNALHQKRQPTILSLRIRMIAIATKDHATAETEEHWRDRLIDQDGNVLLDVERRSLNSYRLIREGGRWKLEHETLIDQP
ncbi:MAG: IMS domain-containing protein [Chloroflexota bacterium]